MKQLIIKYKGVMILTIISVIIGVIVGVIDTIFGKVLLEITAFRDNNPIKLIIFLPLIGAGIIYIYKKYGKNAIKGMGLVFDTAKGNEEKIPKRLIPLVIITTWFTHLFGGSAGREGVAVQIGATVANYFERYVNIKDAKKILIVTGMAAGFAGLFQTPIAAVFFALEVLTVGVIEYKALFYSLIASFISNFVSKSLGLEKFSVALNTNIDFSYVVIAKIIICGIIFGLVGGLFAYLLNNAKKYFSEKLPNPIIRIFSMGIILSLLLIVFHFGRYSGLGTNLISASFTNKPIYYYDWIIKLLLTILTLSIGFQGGEVTPLFSIGASLGIIIAGLFNMPLEFVSALGYIGVFAGATNTLLAPVFIGGEVFGFEYMPYYFIVCAIAYLFNNNKTIYTKQTNIFK